ncbi:cell surface glycoprotein CD200 receptor 2-like isoform X1 [Cricetulus griseus]|uniref:cell surface glycoprotein CD200 receptor 2-like isoform X1 n=1 Tax=Cricetulus griseus TaxID=10029 RepID=UPI0015C3FB12|nr:cell surface glycoprotein CD200 receptor 2-like isoform X1 [Cricetulus griseus]
MNWCEYCRSRAAIGPSYPTPGHRSIGVNIITKRYLYIHDYRCIIRNSKEGDGSRCTPTNEDSAPVSVLMGTKALLCCPPISWTKPVVLITWKITLRGQPPCKIFYNVETKEIGEVNCTDRRITWAFTPDQSPDLQINTVALSHEGHYLCQMASPEGHFKQIHDLQVLVPPEVTLIPGEKRAAVCEAIAGKPAAQISWTPDGYHVTKNESHSNGTVTVRSTYHGEHSNVSAVFCFVSHPTGNQTLSIELNQGVTSPLHSLLTILYAKLSLLGIILLILGFAFLQKRNYFREYGRPSLLEDENRTQLIHGSQDFHLSVEAISRKQESAFPQTLEQAQSALLDMSQC